MTVGRRRYFGLGVLGLVLLGALLVIVNRQAILDWVSLYGYTPPAAVQQIASADTMTSSAQKLFYVNRPAIANGSAFAGKCPSGAEKTVVLGCYQSPDRGIYVYDVTDPCLHGVEEVTSAHEMLHAAYRRLPPAEKTRVDSMLTNYYQHDVTDQRVKDTITAYRTSEPNDVVNEMHSVFGTEVSNLPPELEQYYKQYFADRSKVTGFTASYQAEFSSRQDKIKAYDAQLNSLKQQIDASEASLATQKAAIDSQNQNLQRSRRAGDSATYNSNVASYNEAINVYNESVAATKTLISQYNTIVSQRNSVALEEQELAKAISGTAQPVQ